MQKESTHTCFFRPVNLFTVRLWCLLQKTYRRRNQKWIDLRLPCCCVEQAPFYKLDPPWRSEVQPLYEHSVLSRKNETNLTIDETIALHYFGPKPYHCRQFEAIWQSDLHLRYLYVTFSLLSDRFLFFPDPLGIEPSLNPHPHCHLNGSPLWVGVTPSLYWQCPARREWRKASAVSSASGAIILCTSTKSTCTRVEKQ